MMQADADWLPSVVLLANTKAKRSFRWLHSGVIELRQLA